MKALPPHPPDVSQGQDVTLRGAYAVVQLLTRLGYTLSLNKCSLTPKPEVLFLGMVVDSNRLASILPQDKKTKFQTLHDDILSKPQIDLKSLQRFAGKCTSLMVAIPGALRYTREVNKAISRAQKNGKLVDVEGELKEEIERWCFLDEWEGYVPWRRECHIQVKNRVNKTYIIMVLLGHLEMHMPRIKKKWWTIYLPLCQIDNTTGV